MRNSASSSASRHEWTYYLLGGSKEQLSVWQGTQTSEVGFCGSTGGSQIYFYPTEYLTYGGRSANITTRPNGTQEYRIADHLGSNRVTLDNTGSVVTTTDYAPFGGAIAGVPPRKGFIDKEKDKESGLGDFGVRKYDDEIGRFTSIDPLWEEYLAWSPYHYSYNNPMVLKDPTGFLVDFGGSSQLEQHYRDVMEYFKENGADDAYRILKEVLENEEYTIYMYANYDISESGTSGNEFNQITDILKWNPTGASKYRNEDGEIETTSPALSLLHEVAHAHLKYEEPEKARKLRVQSYDNYGTEEEKYIILEVEYPSAKQVGEVEKPRTAHQGDSKDPLKAGTYYRTNFPTSTEEIE